MDENRLINYGDEEGQNCCCHESSYAASGLLWGYFIGTTMVVPEPLDSAC